jgi:hypothetical protein
MKLDTQVEPNSDTDEFRNEWSRIGHGNDSLHPTGSTVLNRSNGIASKGIKVDGASKTLALSMKPVSDGSVLEMIGSF